MRDTDLAYIAGIFDGEGCVSYKQYDRQRKHNKKPYPTWQIRLEISMTDRSILVWINETLGVGTVSPKRYKTKYSYHISSNGHCNRVQNGNINVSKWRFRSNSQKL